MCKVIELKNYGVKNQSSVKSNPFIKGYATASRLMGVIGVRLHFEQCVLFFHLDYEEYGFDRFQVYTGTNFQDIHKITQSFMGGLGAPLVEISLEEGSSLIYEAVEKGRQYYAEVPLEFFEYEYLLSENCPKVDELLYKKISPILANDYECIHYFFMRTTGLDYKIRDLLLSDQGMDFELCDAPSLLLKSSLQPLGPNTYNAQFLMDYYDTYKLFVCEVEMKNRRVSSINLLDSMQVSAREAALHLSKKEYILVCQSDQISKFERDFKQLKPEHMMHVYPGGNLYTIYENTNHHVRNKNYYLSEDIFMIAYATKTNQIIFSCFKEKHLNRLKEDIKKNYKYIEILLECEANQPIVYQFVNSGSQDFLEYL